MSCGKKDVPVGFPVRASTSAPLATPMLLDEAREDSNLEGTKAAVEDKERMVATADRVDSFMIFSLSMNHGQKSQEWEIVNHLAAFLDGDGGMMGQRMWEFVPICAYVSVVQEPTAGRWLHDGRLEILLSQYTPEYFTVLIPSMIAASYLSHMRYLQILVQQSVCHIACRICN